MDALTIDTTQTLAEFYHSHVFDGRATLVGTDVRPLLWLTKPSRYREMYTIYSDQHDGISLRKGTTSLRLLAWRIRENQTRKAQEADQEWGVGDFV